MHECERERSDVASDCLRDGVDVCRGSEAVARQSWGGDSRAWVLGVGVGMCTGYKGRGDEFFQPQKGGRESRVPRYRL